jgi:hypothetical protein
VDAVLTDPPYGISFMNAKWDYDLPSVEVWQECLRVLKPGGHLLAFNGTPTAHRQICRIEDADFEIRDSILSVYASGFPKSLDVSKAIDETLGTKDKRKVVRERKLLGKARVLKGDNWSGDYDGQKLTETYAYTAPASRLAKKWDRWGTALKPACEIIVMARKPLSGRVAANVLAFGTGALNTRRVPSARHKARVQQSTV